MQNLQKQNTSIWMRTALAVAKTGSPAKGAESLRVSIATVYRHLDALEQTLGVQLFDRQPSGWSLRVEAGPLLHVGQEIERLLADAEKHILEAAATSAKTLNVGVSEDFAARYVAPRLPAFRAACGDIRVNLIVSSEFADLLHGEADVAIRPHREPGDVLIGHRVGRIAHAFYASESFLARMGYPPSLAEAGAHDFCGYGGSLGSYTAALWFDENVDSSRIVARFGSTGALTGAVAAGLGIGLLPCYVGDSIPELTPILPASTGLPVDIWIVTAAANRSRPSIKAFMTFFGAAIRADRNAFRGALYV
jgi:DNA-binding transcriptional LysR family regulator